MNIDNLTDDEQEEMCELCEDLILGCKSSTSTYQCEGCRCAKAFECYKESKEPEEEEVDFLGSVNQIMQERDVTG